MKNRTIIGLSLAIIVLVILLCQRECGNRSKVKAWKASTDELITERDDLGRHLAKKSVLVGKRNQVIGILKAKGDSLSLELAAAIKNSGRGTQTATVINTTTEIIKETPVYIEHTDTIIIGDTVYIYPTYMSEFRDRFIRYKITANQDSVRANIMMENSMAITHKKRRGKIEVLVKNENPYFVTDDVMSYNIKNPHKRFGVGIYAGYGIGLTSFRLEPSVGVSVHWSLFRF